MPQLGQRGSVGLQNRPMSNRREPMFLPTGAAWPMHARSVLDAAPANPSLRITRLHRLRRRQPYRELGPNFFDERDKTRVQRRLVQRLEKLGFTVELRPAA